LQAVFWFNPKTVIGFGRISQRLRAVAHWPLPRRTLWCVERKEQCADAEGFAKGVPNVIAVFGFKANGIAQSAMSGAFVQSRWDSSSYQPTGRLRSQPCNGTLNGNDARRNLFRPWATPPQKNPLLTPPVRESFFHPLKTSHNFFHEQSFSFEEKHIVFRRCCSL
jgi:hypothetical protein